MKYSFFITWCDLDWGEARVWIGHGMGFAESELEQHLLEIGGSAVK